MAGNMEGMNCTLFNGVALCDEPAEKIMSAIMKFSGPGFAYVVTPNVDHFYRLDMPQDDLFRLVYANADLRVCDSRIVQKLSVLEGKSIRNVVPGSDLTERLLASSWARTAKIMIVGPELEDVDFVKRKFSLVNVTSCSPPMGFIKSEVEVATCVDMVIRSSAELVLLAVGSPQQEILAYRIKKAALNAKDKGAIVLCVGASLDFLSGKAVRAPRLMQLLHLEWLHRLCSSPKRLVPRYWSNFVWLLSYVYKHVGLKKSRG
jgi:N-acetylglucosaminyldiphosphoundecaprenol N-acetyl-beta-D-mannosaminyltransferase